MKYFRLFSIILVVLFASLIAHAKHVSDPSLITEGAKLYSENCSRCHNARPASDYSKTEWSVVMPHMREKAHMTGTEALAVEAFLASTLTADVRNELRIASNSNPAKPAKELITQFGCQGCHIVKGVGGNLGPSLDGIVEEKGREFVVKKLKDPKFNNASSAMPQFPMSETEIETMVDFISSK